MPVGGILSASGRDSKCPGHFETVKSPSRGFYRVYRGGGSNSGFGRGHKFFSIPIAAILCSVILCN